MDNSMYKVIKINDKFWAIEDGSVRAFVFEGDNRVLLVDTGHGRGNIRELVESLSNKPITLIYTHTDPDHVGCNSLFTDIYMHPAEFAFYATKGFDTSAVKPVWDGEIIDLGNRKLEVVHTPGHTPGSIALLDRKNRLILTGDPVQVGMIYMFGDIRDINAYIASIKRLIKISDAFDTIYPSHSVLTLKPDILPELIEAATKLRDGYFEGVEPPMNLPCKLYDCGIVKYLYNLRKPD